jgi:RNA polymerase sigma-70 factor (ECF subfamily)
MITTQQLQLLKEGNKNAFEALYRGYNARIYNFLLSIIEVAGW